MCVYVCLCTCTCVHVCMCACMRESESGTYPTTSRLLIWTMPRSIGLRALCPSTMSWLTSEADDSR